MRTFTVTITETLTYRATFTEDDLADRLPGVDVTMLAGDIEDEWLCRVEVSPHMTDLEEYVRYTDADLGSATYALWEN